MAPLAAAGDAEKGQVKAQTCLGCHGVPTYGNVYPSYRVPKLLGQHQEYIVAALKAYQSGERSHPTMRAHASSLSDTDMADIAAYFSAHAVSAAEPAQLSPPQELEEKLTICVACHGIDGNSELPENPRLAGQYRDYLYNTLMSYKNGKRQNAIMAGMAAVLEERDIRMLSLYFSQQQGLATYQLQRATSQ